MEHLRQTQQQYEQELISKGILPYTTEEAIKQYAEQQQQRTQIKTDKIDVNKINRVSKKNEILFE
jgi:SOS response regulatory protein OraA/RecX